MTGGRKRLAVCSLEIKFAAGRVKTGCPHCGYFRWSVCSSTTLILRVVTGFKKEKRLPTTQNAIDGHNRYKAYKRWRINTKVMMRRQKQPDHRKSDCVPSCFNQQPPCPVFVSAGIRVSAVCERCALIGCLTLGNPGRRRKWDFWDCIFDTVCIPSFMHINKKNDMFLSRRELSDIDLVGGWDWLTCTADIKPTVYVRDMSWKTPYVFLKCHFNRFLIRNQL